MEEVILPALPYFGRMGVLRLHMCASLIIILRVRSWHDRLSHWAPTIPTVASPCLMPYGEQSTPSTGGLIVNVQSTLVVPVEYQVVVILSILGPEVLGCWILDKIRISILAAVA